MFTRSKFLRSEESSKIQDYKQNYFIINTVNYVDLISIYLYFKI